MAGSTHPLGRAAADPAAAAGVAALLRGYSIEVLPRTAAKIADFRAILPVGTRVYIAHIHGIPVEDIAATARRLADEGFTAMPHVPVRMIPGRAALADRLARYADAGVTQALVIGGDAGRPAGPYHGTMQALETGLFDAHGFTRLHVAGHPEGSRAIDPDGSERNAMDALRWKNAFAARTDAAMAITTQFCFEAEPVIAWARRLRAEGIGLPIHLGVAGPAKLQTLIRFAAACGVGPSARVLTRRAADLTRMLRPYTPDDVLADIARYKASHPDFNIEAVHVFPLGGIPGAADYLDARTRD